MKLLYLLGCFDAEYWRLLSKSILRIKLLIRYKIIFIRLGPQYPGGYALSDIRIYISLSCARKTF